MEAAQQQQRPSVITDKQFEEGLSPNKTIGSTAQQANQQTPQVVMEQNHDVFEPNWWEFRLKSKMPERRGYHSSFTYRGYLYVFGGKDIGLGHLDNLWRINLTELTEFNNGVSEYEVNPEWELVETSGQVKPIAMSHQSSVVFQKKMYLFGGSTKTQSENLQMFSLDLEKHQWTLLKPNAKDKKQDNLPVTRDEHSCVVYGESMVIFGGFAFGERTNDIFRYDFKANTWEKIPTVSQPNSIPCPRAGHSACIKVDSVNGDCMYIFGGKDDENNKLCDTWKYNFASQEWTMIQAMDEPIARSGHTAQVYDNKWMIIYGGILEVTKELNDMHVFNLHTERWVCLFEELNSPQKSPGTSAQPSSALKKQLTKQQTVNDISPRKSMKETGMNKTGNSKPGAPPTMGSKKSKLQPLKVGAAQVDDREIKLESPTSVTMKNSFLIKNADPSFEKCYAQIRKRAIEKERTGLSPTGYDEKLTKTNGKRPPARDGHTGIIIEHSFFVFGGDRHQMPFNDFFMLDMKSEMAAKSYLF